MENKFSKGRLAAAVGAAALAMGAAAPANAVVVVGGDNGWEISFDGNVNLFYTVSTVTTTSRGLSTSGAATTAPTRTKIDSSHLNEGLLPAFFSFNVTSPTVNGLTGSARIAFAPDSSSAKNTRLDKGFPGGALGNGTIDMREVVGNVSGDFGTFSFGRTLSIFGRQAILNDQTLFGVGAPAGFNNGGGTTLGRIGAGYVYPAFRTRFAYATPNINGFTAEVGIFDPMTPIGTPSAAFESDTPRFEGEVTYATAFDQGTFKGWVGGMWQEIKNQAQSADVTSSAVEVGGKVTYAGFHVTGTYYNGSGLGYILRLDGSSFACGGGTCEEADNDGYYVQGGYTFNGTTMIAASYGENKVDGFVNATTGNVAEQKSDMWTVGVYHDVAPWLKVVGEYSDGKQTRTSAVAGVGNLASRKFDIFSVGAFIFW